jgi:hypothetical protein
MRIERYTALSVEILPSICFMEISGHKFLSLQWFKWRICFSWGEYKEEAPLFPDDYCEPIK